MKDQASRHAYVSELKAMRLKKCSYKNRISLIEGLIDKLKYLSSNPDLITLRTTSKQFVFRTPESKCIQTKNTPSYYSQNQSTTYSFFSDSPEIKQGQNLATQYQHKIMEKRVVKFQVNEEIEALQDDLFQIEKVVETKRTLNDDLAKLIQKKMKQIGSSVKTTKEDPSSSQLINGQNNNKKQQNYKDSMNMTISGASGFRFNKKSQFGNNTSLNFTKPDIMINHLKSDVQSSQMHRKKAKSHYLNKSIGTVTGLFKNILK